METAATVDASIPVRESWPLWQRCLFRFVLLYYAIYAFPGPLGSLARTIQGGLVHVGLDPSLEPWSWIGISLQWIGEAWQSITSKMAELGCSPYEVIHQRTGSGDTGHAFAKFLFALSVASLGMLLWCGVSSARAYPRLGRWLHLCVRFDLAFALLGYGSAKFYGGQFGELTLARLTQEIGDTWPMTMVGTFLQASKPYELFGGACEVLSALLLFHRRTALLGACFAIATMTNVCALNWLYGVPVKLYSSHLLLYGIGLLAPFAPQLCAVFLRNRPSQPVDLRVARGALARYALLLIGGAWVGSALLVTHLQGIEPKPWLADRERTELYGLWTIESMKIDGEEVPLTSAERWRDFAIERNPTAWARELSGERHFFELRYDATTRIAQVKSRGSSESPAPWIAELGTKIVKGDPPLLLRNEERGKPVDVERRSLLLRGSWNGRALELELVEKRFRLQTEFRLRQELPDFW
ncbi:MAG: hypothetical protein JNM84_15305 [Planctomycetes bacterium]|nr:hypothetical protein [Planctomycetota bacterium]